MKDRIRHILEWTNLSQQDFATRLGISPASLSSIFTGRTNPTNNHVQAIHRAFPEINVSWLLFGEGTMMANEQVADNLHGENDGGTKISDEGSVSDSGMMASIFSEEDYGPSLHTESSVYNSGGNRRDNYGSRPVGFNYIDNAKKNDNKKRRIKEIRVFFDDGTYEAFVPSSGK